MHSDIFAKRRGMITLTVAILHIFVLFDLFHIHFKDFLASFLFHHDRP